jgi:hypothetical protein
MSRPEIACHIKTIQDETIGQIIRKSKAKGYLLIVITHNKGTI